MIIQMNKKKSDQIYRIKTTNNRAIEYFFLHSFLLIAKKKASFCFIYPFLFLFFYSFTLPLCTTSINSKFAIFQKFIFKYKIVPFACLPSFIIEKYVCTLLIIICDRFWFFVPLKPHHMFGMKTP
jgi:hypothetical protein